MKTAIELCQKAKTKLKRFLEQNLKNKERFEKEVLCWNCGICPKCGSENIFDRNSNESILYAKSQHFECRDCSYIHNLTFKEEAPKK